MCLHIPPVLWDRRCAADLLRSYWGTHWDGSPVYTGSRFERLAGGGDRSPTENHFTADDVVAVAALGVSIPAPAALRLLEPDRPDHFSGLLAQLPVDVDLADADDDLIGEKGWGWRLWELLRGLNGIGPVSAGKLLARKRPHLFPVYDSVIKRVFDRPEEDLLFWVDVQCELRKDNRRLVNHLEDVRDAAGIGDDISVLRVLDTMAWRHGKKTMAPPGASAGKRG
ncbi:DUF6308 family protein [Streptomyces sp. 8N706]|uniref:DUF6308 family protein n=1 Tax=Streptomyces sp. 8N706 TaxID=3457416 RepID=UPI003FD0C8BD